MLSVLPRCSVVLPCIRPSPYRHPARRWLAVFAAGAIPFTSTRCCVGMDPMDGRMHQPQLQRLRLHTRCEGKASDHLQIEFCGRPAKGYTPIYYENAETNTASVNAGDFNLYVGGGAINWAFAKELRLAGKNDYQEMHEALLQAAADTPGHTVNGIDVPTADHLRQKLGLLACYARVHGQRQKGDLSPVGVAFLDIFGTSRPLSQKNVAMLYVVGPKGTGAPGGHGPTVDSNTEFLAAVEDMASNAISIVAAYNAEIKEERKQEEMPPIETLQFCLVSGGVYMHPDSTKTDVAKAILQGLRSGEAKASDLPVVRFAYDSNSFEEAVAAEVVTPASPVAEATSGYGGSTT